jgi:hypothetical protein
MSDTSFTNGTTLTDADWFNDVNRLHYTILGDPANVAAVRTALSIGPVLVVPPSTAATALDFTGIPAGTKRITIMFDGLSSDGSDALLIQMGDAGGVEASGYLGASSALTNGSAVIAANYTTGFGILNGTAGNIFHGSITLSLEKASSFTWVANGQVALSNSATNTLTAGRKATSAALDRVRVTTLNGTDTFDAGEVSISYE